MLVSYEHACMAYVTWNEKDLCTASNSVTLPFINYLILGKYVNS